MTETAGRQGYGDGAVGRLKALAADITTATTRSGEGDSKASLLAPVVLANAGRGFAVGGVVSDMLDRHALPRRDNFVTCAECCARTVAMLRKVLGPNMMRRYSSGVSDADLMELADVIEAELADATPEDVEPIAAAMITLGAVLHTATRPLADNPDLPGEIRGAARMMADGAEILRTHYGGDAGGW